MTATKRQPHRDLVGDHLGGAAKPAEQGVGRAGRPASEHDPVDADRRDRQDEEHGDRKVGQLQRRLDACPRDPDDGAQGDHRERDERRGARDHRGEEEDELVRVDRCEVLLEHQLHAVGQALQQPEGTVHVGPDPVLHPGDHATLCPDAEEGEQNQQDEDRQRLDRDDPPRVAPERAEVGAQARHNELGSHHFSPSSVTALPAPTARSRRRLTPAEFVGVQTTPSTTSPTATGSVTAPVAVVSRAVCPSVRPSELEGRSRDQASRRRAVAR